MGVLLACVSVHYIHVISTEVREECNYLGPGVIDGLVLPCECWKPNKSSATVASSLNC